jgi:rRNA maturation protein Nop10
MKRFDSIRKHMLTCFFAACLVLCAGVTRAAAQTVWLVCVFDTSSISKGKDGREKFERRFYVSPLVSLPKDDFLKVDSTGDRIEGVCADYLDKTVNKAAQSRGEKLDPGATLKVIRNIELSGEDAGSPNPYNFAPKDKIEKLRSDQIREAQDAGRVVYTFNWDPTGNNEAADLENEMKRTQPTIGPTPSSKTGKP